MLGISGDKRRRFLGEPYSSEDKGPVLKSVKEEEEEGDEDDKVRVWYGT